MCKVGQRALQREIVFGGVSQIYTSVQRVVRVGFYRSMLVLCWFHVDFNVTMFFIYRSTRVIWSLWLRLNSLLFLGFENFKKWWFRFKIKVFFCDFDPKIVFSSNFRTKITILCRSEMKNIYLKKKTLFRKIVKNELFRTKMNRFRSKFLNLNMQSILNCN